MQPSGPLYSEKQRFRQWYLWMLILIGPAISIWAVFQQLVLDLPFGNNPVPDYVLFVFVAIVGGGLPLFMYSTGLDTSVRNCGVCIRYGKKGKAYNVSGDQGVRLTLKDGKTVLIGSRNHEMLCSAINEFLS